MTTATTLERRSATPLASRMDTLVCDLLYASSDGKRTTRKVGCMTSSMVGYSRTTGESIFYRKSCKRWDCAGCVDCILKVKVNSRILKGMIRVGGKYGLWTAQIPEGAYAAVRMGIKNRNGRYAALLNVTGAVKDQEILILSDTEEPRLTWTPIEELVTLLPLYVRPDVLNGKHKVRWSKEWPMPDDNPNTNDYEWAEVVESPEDITKQLAEMGIKVREEKRADGSIAYHAQLDTPEARAWATRVVAFHPDSPLPPPLTLIE